MFNNQQSLSLSFPKKGISVGDKNPESAKYIENILMHNNVGTIRHGTILAKDFVFDADRLFKKILHITSYLNEDGTSKILIYVNYLIKLPHITRDKVTVAVGPIPNTSTINIDITDLPVEQKAYLSKICYDGVLLYISQLDLPFEKRIEAIDIGDDYINFCLPSHIDNFSFEDDGEGNDIPAFDFWIERAGIYPEGMRDFSNVLIDDLDPNVIPISVVFQNKLIFANGIDPVLIYDGVNITQLLSPLQVTTTVDDDIVKNGVDITFFVPLDHKVEYVEHLVVNKHIILRDGPEEQELVITGIVFTDEDPKVKVEIKLNVNITLDNITNIIYDKPIPNFSYIAVGNKRLWALGEGRTYKDKFRPNKQSQKVYYTKKLEDPYSWYDDTGIIGLIDLSFENDKNDNLEVIKCFQGEMFFIGRHTTQLWNNGDPTYVMNEEYEHDVGTFKHVENFEVGIYQKALIQELPNNLIIISNFGKSNSFYRDRYGRIQLNENFIDPIKDYLTSQFSNIKTDNDYRSLNSFNYPFNNMVGLKINNECIIYQIVNAETGFWTTFSGNFVKARSFHYNTVDRNLYLGLDNGTMLKYADKSGTKTYVDYDVITKVNNKIPWSLFTNDIELGNKWVNKYIYFDGLTLKPIDININVILDHDETESLEESIVIQDVGSFYDLHHFGEAIYTKKHRLYPSEMLEFNSESFTLELKGFGEDYFAIDKIILTGYIPKT